MQGPVSKKHIEFLCHRLGDMFAGWIIRKSEESVRREQTCVPHIWPKPALLRGNHLADIRFRGLSTVGPAQSFPSLKPLNSPPKRLGRLGNNSFTLQQYIKISGCSYWQAAGKTQDRDLLHLCLI